MACGKGAIIAPGFTNGKDYTAEMLCEEAGNISPLQKNSHVK
jgi:hypothetical protein